jgi:putative redox protein
MRKSQRVEFPGARGTLAGILEIPSHIAIEEIRGWFLFSHCFTCNKDLKAIVRVARGLADHGWGVLRYDFSGLGNSQGTFSQTNFSTNCEDLASAADFLSTNFLNAPRFLIGHSFGGAASLAMANEILSCLGVITLAAPSDTQHLAKLLLRMDPAIGTDGTGQVTIGGQTLRIDKQMIDNFLAQDLPSKVKEMEKPLLIFHSPADETVAYSHALKLMNSAEAIDGQLPYGNSSRSLVSLPGSNHLLTNNDRDIPFIVGTIHAWASRFI